MSKNCNSKPKLVVFTTLFPSSVRPGAGLFIRERMFRVGKELPLVVVCPVPWFPLQRIIQVFRPQYRPMPKKVEKQGNITVYYPRFLSIPIILRILDGLFIAIGSLRVLRKIDRSLGIDIIDSHFAYPDGYAATLLGKWLGKPVTITLRGTEIPISKMAVRKRLMVSGLDRASKIFSVSESLKQHVLGLGIDEEKVRVVGNGVDSDLFYPLDRKSSRNSLNIDEDSRVLITIGGLVERKGFHRVIECLPKLLPRFPNLKYLVVGGPSPEGNWEKRLKDQVEELGLEGVVYFLGQQPPVRLKYLLSASDVFVLATSNEGWANVFLEAMACGVPVVTTRVGGNAEVVSSEEFGVLVPFGDQAALTKAIDYALKRKWDNDAIREYAVKNSWDDRVRVLVKEFCNIAGESDK